MTEKKTRQAAKRALKIISTLAFVILASCGIRSRLFSEEKGVACRIVTAEGEIRVMVYPEKAPATAVNFLRYVEASLYNGSTFFRVLTPENQPGNAFRIEVRAATWMKRSASRPLPMKPQK